MEREEQQAVVALQTDDELYAVCVAFNNKMIATGGEAEEYAVILLMHDDDEMKWKKVVATAGHTCWVYCLSFAGEKDEWLLSGSRDRTAILWDVEKRTSVHIFQCNQQGVPSPRGSISARCLTPTSL